MTDRLSIYNEACRYLEEGRLENLEENRKVRRELDAIWKDGGVDAGVILRCLNEGLWRFALRAIEIDKDNTIEPEFGYRSAFQQPKDYVRLSEISLDEHFNTPFRDYNVEAGYWYCDHSRLYVRYVSSDPKYGFNYARMSPLFVKYVAKYMASEAAPVIASKLSGRLMEEADRARANAISKETQEAPTKYFPQGSWTRARGASQSSGHDRGSRNKLIG